VPDPLQAGSRQFLTGEMTVPQAAGKFNKAFLVHGTGYRDCCFVCQACRSVAGYSITFGTR
jgi:hypothetical protein